MELVIYVLLTLTYSPDRTRIVRALDSPIDSVIGSALTNHSVEVVLLDVNHSNEALIVQQLDDVESRVTVEWLLEADALRPDLCEPKNEVSSLRLDHFIAADALASANQPLGELLKAYLREGLALAEAVLPPGDGLIYI